MILQRAPVRVLFAAALALSATTAIAQPRAPQPHLPMPQPQGGDAPGGGAKAVSPMSGQQVYQQVCQSCHMADAMGGVGAARIPGLASNPHLAVAAYPVIMVVKGHGAMPGFTDLLTSTEIADVVTYVRTHFGNAYPKPVTAAEVTQLGGGK
jgi:mono/diheme cytochrome c family protein